MGASIAYHLSRRGAQVTVLERSKPAAAATGNSFAWLNAGSKQPRHYYELNRMGMAGWRRLQNELGDEHLRIQWGGTVRWQDDAEKAEKYRQAIARQQSWGYSTYLVTPEEVRRLLPNVDPGRVLIASFCDEEGSLDPIAATGVLLEAARKHGAEVIYPSNVTGFDGSGGNISAVLAGERRFAADAVVLAAGVDTARLAPLLNAVVPMVDSPGILAHTKPRSKLLEKVAVAPGATLKQLPNGTIVTGLDFGGSPSTDTSAATGRELIANAARYLTKLEGAPLDRVTLGWRVMPADSYPIVGPLAEAPGVYVAAMHSGITLAPVIGQLAALEILERVEVDTLAPYRPSRFAKVS